MNEIRIKLEHSKAALRAGKCVQCQFPWHDGICSCGGWGAEEERVAGLIQALDEESRAMAARMNERAKKEVEEIDASLKPEDEIESLWEDGP